MESNIVARILDGSIDLVVNTPHGVTAGGSPRVDGWSIRTAAVTANIPCITTVQGLAAAVQGIEALRAAASASAPCRTGRRRCGRERDAGRAPALRCRCAARCSRSAGSAPTSTSRCVAPGVPQRTRPGHFVALAVGGEQSSMLLRRAFSVYRVRETGVHGGTVEIVFAAHGAGTRWLAERRPHDPIDVIGPLGRPFALPKEAVPCTLVAGGYGSAPMFALAERLKDRGCGVHMVLGAATEARLFGVLEARRSAQSVTVLTEDGSVGQRGRVTDALPALLTRTRSDVVYACGPMGMLRAVAAVAAQHGAHSQCAVEEAMACGVGCA
jgi:dihydroorotate dehydrogenase electron transfer subunit